ncbi:MAG: iron-sulfur cluster biosynthesis family protein [Solirubrobacteraceae bacterium]
MLTITSDAADALRAVLGAKEGGVRISTGTSLNGNGPNLTLEVVPEPEPDDEVLDADGASLYLDPVAVDALDGKVLDAEREADAVRFSVFDGE